VPDAPATLLLDEQLIANALATAPVGKADAFDTSRVLALALAGTNDNPFDHRRGRLGQRPIAALATTAIVATVAAAAILGGGHWPTRTIPASWAYAYGSLAEIGAAANLVVVGSVTRMVRQDTIADLGYPQTVFELGVSRTLKGPAASEIEFVQDGGPVDGTWVELEDFPLVSSGDQVLLFLRPIQRDGETLWVIVGGPYGLFHVVNGKVEPLAGAAAIPMPRPLTVDQVAAVVH